MKIILSIALSLLVFTSSAFAGNYSYYSYKRTYEVSITNVTKDQSFTPQLVATHSRGVSVFTVGDAASEELAILAEGGDTAPLTSLLQSLGSKVGDVQTIGGLLAPGATATITVEATPRQRALTVAAMLIPTNDTFVALNTVRLPIRGKISYWAKAYDSGTEDNDQNCLNIPGPRCAGEGFNAEGGEGFIHISNGFHDLGDYDAYGNEILSPFDYDWRNPVARITVKRVH